MNHLEIIYSKQKINHQLIVLASIFGIIAGTVFWTKFLIWFIKGTIEYIKTF